jgi:hypothetical protein
VIEVLIRSTGENRKIRVVRDNASTGDDAADDQDVKQKSGMQIAL